MNNIISELICTRISHDIIGNIGAVANASELLEEGDMDFIDDIKSILKVSSFNMTARMKFFRMAFGVDNNNLENIELVKKTAEDYLASLGNIDYPIKLDWMITSSGLVKNAFVGIMVMADLLIRGGVIKVVEKEGVIKISFSMENKFSQDKLQKFHTSLESEISAFDANTAHIACLSERMPVEKIKFINDENNNNLTLVLG